MPFHCPSLSRLLKARPHQNPSSSQSSGSRRLEVTQDALTRVADVATCVPIPLVRESMLAANALVGIISTIKANRRDREALIKHIKTILRPLEEHTFDVSDDERLGELSKSLKEISSKLERYATESHFWFASIKNALIEARQDVNDAVKVFLVQNTVENRIGDMERISPGELDLQRYVPDHEERNILQASYRGNTVIVKKYMVWQSWKTDLKAWRRNREPHYLQFIVYAKEADSIFLVLRDPGILVQHQLQQKCGDPKVAAMYILDVTCNLVSAAKIISKSENGGCDLRSADVYVRGDLPVLVNFDPGRFYATGEGEEKVETQKTWDAFLSLVAKSFTGYDTQPNYLAGEYGSTGVVATRISKFFLHFLWDFKFTIASSHTQITNLFDQLSDITNKLKEDVRNSKLDMRDPLLASLKRRFPALLCGIWDVWETLDVDAGDIGVLRGADKMRPTFKKFTQVMAHLREETLFPELQYNPDSSSWSTSISSDGSTRDFGFVRGRHVVKLGSKWDYTDAWSYLDKHRDFVEALARDNGEDPQDVCLVYSRAKCRAYTKLRIKDTAEHGTFYFYENPDPKEGQVMGYWSLSSEPGEPLWPTSPDAPGPSWGWDYR